MVYWYDTGITTESILRVSRVIDREIYLVSQSISSMRGLFDENIVDLTEEQEKKKYLPELLHDKITSQDLFGDITDSDDDDHDEDDDEKSSLDTVENNESSTSTSYISTPKRKKSVTIYECKSNPDIDWDKLQYLQIKKSVATKRSQQDSNFSENPSKVAALDIISQTRQQLFKERDELADIKDISSKESTTDSNSIETPNLKYDTDLIFG